MYFLKYDYIILLCSNIYYFFVLKMFKFNTIIVKNSYKLYFKLILIL